MPDQSSKITRVGLNDSFIENYGTQEDLLNENSLSVKNLIKKICD